MEFINGNDRILFIKLNGNWLPIGCLTDNSLEESSEFIDTTTRDNGGWATSRPALQNYSISFTGVQLNTTVAGGNFSIASYDRLKKLKRAKQLLEWKIQGTLFPVVDYGKGYIGTISESNVVDEFMTFSGSITGFGEPLTAILGTEVLNSGNPNEIINNGNPNIIIRTTEL